MADYDDYTDYSDQALPDADTSPNTLTPNDYTTTGTTNYQTDTGYTGDSGSVINSSANPVTSNSGPVDASGGNGSFPNVLQSLQTQGLDDDVISAGEYALGSLTDLLRVGAQGRTTVASAPSAPTLSLNASAPKWLWIGVGAVILYFVIKKL
jgi:hypothetical protein